MAERRLHPENTDRTETAGAAEELSQEQRIERLKERVSELTGGRMEVEDADMEPDLLEQYLEHVVMIEEAGWSVPAALLEEGGLELTPPDELDDEALSQKLREVVHAMALRNMYVASTDHLSDRELYTELVEEHLAEESFMGPATPVRGFNYIIDFVGSGSEEDMYLYHKYYADDRARRSWLEDFPDDDMPAKETPPYDRDRFLPQPDWTPPDLDDDEPLM